MEEPLVLWVETVDRTSWFKSFESLGAGRKPGNFLIHQLPVSDEEWRSHWMLCRDSQQSNGQVRDWIQRFAPLTIDYASSCPLPLRSPPSTVMWPLGTGTRRVFPRVTLGRVSGGGLGYSAEHTEVAASAGQVLGTHLLR